MYANGDSIKAHFEREVFVKGHCQKSYLISNNKVEGYFEEEYKILKGTKSFSDGKTYCGSF